ncbi:MAG: rhodanese-like domain-containing protein [Trueperaceae bacterium]|nr:rhodanese-like domain-containing protein [Trueperaceae bacterium]
MTSPDVPAELPEIEPHEAHRRIAAGALHVDVREPDEFARVRIEGATLLPLSEFSNRFEELPHDREIVVSCRSGARSGRATAFLRERGYDAVNLGGGILAWEEEGLSVERD